MQMAQITEELRADEAQTIEADLRDKILDRFPAQPQTKTTARRPHVRLAWGVAATIGIVGFVVANTWLRGQQATPALQMAAYQASYSPDEPQPVQSNTKQMGLAQMQYVQERDEAYPASSSAHLQANPRYLIPSDNDSRQVHKEASIGVDVADPEAASDDVEGKVKAMGGYVETSSLSTGGDGRRTASMSVKVPVDQFETFMNQVSHLGTVTAKDVKSEDITEKASDARQRKGVLEDETAKAEARLKLLGKKSKWDDAETARELRVQVAQARARLVLLNKLGELSDVEVTLTQKEKPAPPPTSGFVSGMSDTTSSAFGSLLGAVSVLATMLIWILIYAPIWIPAGLVGRWLYRRYRTVDNQTSA